MLAPKLNYGDTIGVVGVSNSIYLNNKYEDFIRAEEFLKSKGFKIKRGKYVLEDYYGSAGTREQKAEDLMNMFLDDEVKCIICLLGGQTCNTFIDLIDYNIIKEHPKIIIGYSDITVLLQTIYKKTGLITFSGPDFIDFSKESKEETFKEFESVLINKKLDKFIKSQNKIIKSGKAKGRIIGTNLGCMMNLLGTEYLPDMKEKILLIESYITSPNECQRRFAHLKQYGIFNEVNAIIIGYNYDLQKDGDIYPQMEDIILDYVQEYKFPIIKCNSFGHKIVNSVIPIGTEMELVEEKFNILEDFLK